MTAADQAGTPAALGASRLLVTRRHVDLLRVSSALCRASVDRH